MSKNAPPSSAAFWPRFTMLRFLFSLSAIFSATAAAEAANFVISTTDPAQINGQTNAYLFDLIDTTPLADPLVLRVDTMTDALVQHATTQIATHADRVAFVTNGLGFTNIWDAVLLIEGQQSIDRSAFAAALLATDSANVPPQVPATFLERRDQALLLQQTRNFTDEVIRDYRRVETLAHDGGATATADEFSILEVAPLYQVSYGYEDATNAKMVDYGTVSHLDNRCMVWLNIGARRMLQEDVWTSAVVHETWHCFQYAAALQRHNTIGDTTIGTPTTLWRASLGEGVVTYLTSLTEPDISDADLLFWSNEEFLAAEEHREQLVQLFSMVRDSTDAAARRDWLVLGPSSPLLGAPSRSGYYLAYLAMHAYVQQLQDEGDPLTEDTSVLIRHILGISVTAQGQEDIWQALVSGEAA